MKEPVLVIIKPDAMKAGLVGSILNKFAAAELEIIALKLIYPTQEIAEEHYKNIKGQPFYKITIDYFIGKYHKIDRLVALVFYGDKAIEKCRAIAGATNPEDADDWTIRGSYGRITADGIFENAVHVSATKEEAEHEIKLWFMPEEITKDIYTTGTKVGFHKTKVWK